MKIYFMGICGTAMGNAALLMRECGHNVFGADTGVYPPMSTMLKDAGIDILEGWSTERLKKLAPDLVVVGNANSRGHVEIEWLLNEHKLAYTSVPELLNRTILSKRHNIVVSGTHGKTTTTAMAAYLLRETGKNPGWLVGGVPRDLPTGSHLGGSDASFVIEGDEYDSAFFDKRSKFIHYNPKILIINNIEMDHADIFRDITDVIRAFRHVTRIVPGNGWVLMNGDDANVLSLLPMSWTRAMKVGVSEGCDLRILNFKDGPDGASFDLAFRGKILPVKLAINGLFNVRNAAMAMLSAALSTGDDLDNLPLEQFVPIIGKFQGVHRRQEVLVNTPQVVAIEDFGHHPTALANTIDALRAKFPGRKIVAAFEPRSNTAVTNLFQKEFTDALAHSDVALIGHVHRAERLAPEKRLDTSKIAAEINKRGGKAVATDSNEHLLSELLTLTNNAHKQPILVCFFSNGSFDGIIKGFCEGVKA
jgi:UDP-N-acetylmuramate: L-alanyl-gamma-D-glutamyl-meso-diaminopimelate ligase